MLSIPYILDGRRKGGVGKVTIRHYQGLVEPPKGSNYWVKVPLSCSSRSCPHSKGMVLIMPRPHSPPLVVQ